jgi:dTDP-4-amino-4,6-dideoxygalactose transaminase
MNGMEIPFIDLGAMHHGLSVELDDAWVRIRRTDAFIGGEAVERFEAEWADYCAADHCVGIANGTAALELTLKAMDIGPGDEVIVPGNTFIATAEAVVAAGARPVFIDVDPATLLMTAEGVQAMITGRTAAVVVVHLYGQPADMDALGAVARAAGIAIIEDAAQAHGATWNGKPAGSQSDAGCFSFYPGKNLGAFGDAGAVVTQDPALARRIRMLSNHGRPAGAPHLHEMVGGTNRLDALQAAILSIKLKRLDDWNAGREHAMQLYRNALRDMPVEFVRTAPGARSCHHLAVIQVDRRDDLRRSLAAADIATGIHYPIPCHRQRPFLDERTPPLPVTERAAHRILSLPMYPHLTEEQVYHVAEAIGRAMAEPEMNRR